jgi:hypothetical protein
MEIHCCAHNNLELEPKPVQILMPYAFKSNFNITLQSERLHTYATCSNYLSLVYVVTLIV